MGSGAGTGKGLLFCYHRVISPRSLQVVVTLLALGCSRGTTPPSAITFRVERGPEVATPAVEDAMVPAPPANPAFADPRELPLAPGRTVYYALPPASEGARLIGHLHGVCGGPEHACGRWIHAAVEQGVLVCPTGNTRCGGTASWEGPNWGDLLLTMDHDLEKSVASVMKEHPRAVQRKDSILTGYSRGGFAVPEIARLHPGMWPLLLIIEANVPLYAQRLREVGARRVVLIAGENGTERPGMAKTRDQLVAAGFPVRMYLMPGSYHHYSSDMEDIMRRALAFLVEEPD